VVGGGGVEGVCVVGGGVFFFGGGGGVGGFLLLSPAKRKKEEEGGRAVARFVMCLMARKDVKTCDRARREAKPRLTVVARAGPNANAPVREGGPESFSVRAAGGRKEETVISAAEKRKNRKSD